MYRAQRTKSTESLGSPPRTQNQDSMTSWTDDLPVCHLSGVGFSTNQIYREDGKRQEDHEFEDRSFHFRLDDDCFLYGVFDGHNGSNASNFAAQRLPAELLFGQLSGKTDCQKIQESLIQAFLAVEKSFFEQMDKTLAEKTTLLLHFPEGVTHNEAFQRNPDIANKLKNLESHIAGGTAAVIALVFNNKLYVANVGDTRALLVKKGDNDVLTVNQLSDDHTINNEYELERLAKLGLDVELLIQQRRIGTSDNTRCIGDYHVKGGRADLQYLREAEGEPVIAEPYVCGGIEIDESCQFLMIMSDGLYHAMQDSTGLERVNARIAAMVAEEFATQGTLNGVAQAVVDRVVRGHNDTYLMGVHEGRQTCQKCGDITLLVRQFHCPLPKALSSPTAAARFYPVSVPFYQARSSNRSVVIPSASGKLSRQQRGTLTQTPSPIQATTPTNVGEQARGIAASGLSAISSNNTTASSTGSTQSSVGTHLFTREDPHKLVLDEGGRIEAYVDFSAFYDTVNTMSDVQRIDLIEQLMPKTGYEPIMEVNTPTEETSPMLDSDLFI